MKTAQILRKYVPDEWAGTEAAVFRLVQGLRQHRVAAKIYAPSIPFPQPGPFELDDFDVYRAHSFLPIWGLTEEKRTQLFALGGNLLSFDLIKALWSEPNLSLIHTHALGLFGGIALTVARLRRIPVVVSIHGGALDLPKEAVTALQAPLKGTITWGKPFSLLLRARNLLRDADLVLTSNPREAALLYARYPEQRIEIVPHAIDSAPFSIDQREAALKAYPEIAGRDLLLIVGRIDPVKNPLWVIEQLPSLLRLYPNLKLLLAGACTNASYAKLLWQRVAELQLSEAVLWVGELPPTDPRLIGLIQQAKVLILPSLSETFGLVILEAWAAGTAVLASRTSGAVSLIEPGKSGSLFDLEDPSSFSRALGDLLSQPALRQKMAAFAKKHVVEAYGVSALGARMAELYADLIRHKAQ